jgi:hypothetical protein
MADDDPALLEVDPLHAELGSSTLSVRICPGDHKGGRGWDVTLLVLGKDAASVPKPDTSLERLAAWVRTRLSKKSFALALAEEQWIERASRALDGEGFCDRDESGLKLVVHVPKLPSAEALGAWLKARLADVATRVWERPPQST